MNSLDLQAVESIAVRAVQIYAETHPRPPDVTQKQAALMLRRSTATVSRLVAAGLLTRNKGGMIPIHQIDAMILAKAA